MKQSLKIPTALIDEVARGSAALFFGAGASKGASHPNPKTSMPTGDQLRDLVCGEFLRGTCKDRTLDEVAAFVENEGGPVRLEAFIAKLMSPFIPSRGHRLLPKFRWQALYSLNYDKLIETAYTEDADRMQPIHVISKDEQSIDRTLRDDPSAVALFKLHGCIDRLNDPQAPLILSQDSYLRWHEGRKRLYSRLEDSVAEYAVVFCGTTLGDPHIRKILSDASVRRPMQYIVSPSLNEHDSALFAAKRITPICATFDEFMEALDAEVPAVRRRMEAAAGPVSGHPISRHFNKRVEVPGSLLAFITDNCEYVHAGMPTHSVVPQIFYKGESHSWSPIEQKLDIARTPYEPLMLKVMAVQGQPTVDVFALRGVAGAGKSVLLRRVAFDLATTYGQLVIFAQPRAILRAEPLRELYNLTGKRVTLVVDQAADQIGMLSEIATRMAGWSIPFTLIIADAPAAFGSSLDEFDEYLRFTYDLRNLSRAEIVSLLEKLEAHDCLGVLKGLTPLERIESFERIADRQLLVALYEATQGKPLEQIILDEYNRIAMTEAQELYLLVCSLNQYKTPVRAGLIRRLTGIDFNEFEKRLLGPLSDVVFAVRDPISRDWAFRARHSHIAQILFRTVLTTNAKRVNQFRRIILEMDTSYSSDNDALRQMINYKNLRDVAPILKDRREIIRVAEEATGSEPFVLQQRALVEMNDVKGDLDVARESLDRAQAMRPNDRTLKHTRATLLAREARALPNNLSRKVARSEAKGILRSLSGDRTDPYVASLMAQIAIDEIGDRIGELEGNVAADAQILRLVEDAQRAIRDGLAKAPDFENLTLSESRLREMLGQNDRAVSTLKRALETQPQLEFIAVAYARAIRFKDLEGATEAVGRSLLHHPYSKPLNQTLFELLQQSGDDSRDELVIPLRRSFTNDDGNLAMHIHLMRFHFLRGEREPYEGARDIARKLKIGRHEKERPRYPYPNPASPDGKYQATVTSINENFAFARIGGMPDEIFLRPGGGVEVEAWEELGKGRSIRARLCFNAFGAVGADLEMLA